MISYWGIDHGGEVSKGAEEKWHMGRSLEKQGYHSKDKKPTGRMTAAANRGARKELDQGGRRIRRGLAIGAATGAVLAGRGRRAYGAGFGGAAGAGAGTGYAVYRGMKGQNDAFRQQLGRELQSGNVKYRKKG